LSWNQRAQEGMCRQDLPPHGFICATLADGLVCALFVGTYIFVDTYKIV